MIKKETCYFLKTKTWSLLKKIIAFQERYQPFQWNYAEERKIFLRPLWRHLHCKMTWYIVLITYLNSWKRIMKSTKVISLPCVTERSSGQPGIVPGTRPVFCATEIIFRSWPISWFVSRYINLLLSGLV